MPTSEARTIVGRPRRNWRWPSFLRRPVCTHCGAIRAKRPFQRPFQRPYAWCWKCEALLDPEQVLLGEPGSMRLEQQVLMSHSDPVSKLVGLVVLLAIADGSEEVVFDPSAEELRLTYLIDRVSYELVPPPYELRHAISHVLKAISQLDPHQTGQQAGQFAILLNDTGDVDQVADIYFTTTEFGERVSIRFPQHRDPRPDLMKELRA